MNKYSDIKLRQTISNLSSLPLLKLKPLTDSFDLSFKQTYSILNIQNISNLSSLENSRAQNLSERVLKTPPSSFSSPKTLYSASPNFKTLLDQLEQISESPNSIHHLKERRIHSTVLSEGNSCHYQIHCKNKRSPMNFIIKRKSGSLKCFVSKNKSMPSEECYEYCSSADVFEVFGSTSWFQENFYFLSIIAVSSANYSVQVTFGKNKTNPEFVSQGVEFDLPNLDNFRELLTKRVEGIKKARRLKALEIGHCKNFVQSNKISTSPMSKVQKWDNKHKSVLSKKTLAFEERQKKVIESLNKKKEKILQIEQAKEVLKLKPKFQSAHKLWFQLIYFSISIFIVKDTIHEVKELKISRLKSMKSIRMIQNTFRYHINHLSPNQISVLNIRNHLILMHNTLFKYQKSNQSRFLSSFLQASYLSTKAKKAFKTYISRIIFVQYQVKKFLKKHRIRYMEMIRLWNQVLSKLIMDNNKNINYTKIPVQSREIIIRRYLRECNKKYERKMRIYQSVYSIGAKCRTSFSSKKSGLYPKFDFYPDEEALKDMINEALRIKGVSNK